MKTLHHFIIVLSLISGLMACKQEDLQIIDRIQEDSSGGPSTGGEDDGSGNGDGGPAPIVEIEPTPLPVQVNLSGCADESREGFKNLEKFPHIAACAGGFQFPGTTLLSYLSLCQHNAGNDSDNPAGHGCSILDVCAPGWVPVPSVEAFAQLTKGKYCKAMEKIDDDLAFVTGVTGPGNSNVYEKFSDYLYALDNFSAYSANGHNKHLNDTFHCGNIGGNPYNSGKKYFTKFSHNNCSQMSFSSCNSLGGHFEALHYTQNLETKANGKLYGGGVVCVQEDQIHSLNNLTSSCQNLVANGSFEQGHGFTKAGWNVFGELPGWKADLQLNDAPIEIQFSTGAYAGIKAAHGFTKVELDSHNKNGFKASDVAMVQTINVEPGVTYKFSFKHSGRVKGKDTHTFNVVVDNQIVKTINNDKLGWVTEIIEVIPTTDTLSVMFEAKVDNDTLGAYVDDVKLVKTSCTL